MLGAAELASRAVGTPPEGPRIVLEDSGERWPAFTNPDPRLGWRQAPGISSTDPLWVRWARQWELPGADRERVLTNARGWRDDPLPAEKPAGQRWVLALGDSSVWGSGVPAEDRFTERLESMLDPHEVEIWNAAVPGYSTWQARAVLEETADLPLDGVLLYTLNSDTGAARGVPDDLWFSSPARQRGTALLGHSALYGWMRFWVFRARAAQRLGRDPEMKLRVHIDQYRRNLAALVDTAQTRGAFVIGVLPPQRTDVAAPTRRGSPYAPTTDAERADLAAHLEHLATAPSAEATTADYRAAMLLELGARGVPVVDAPAAFTAEMARDPDRYVGSQQLFVDSVHPSAEGHRVLAELIAPPLGAALASPGPAR